MTRIQRFAWISAGTLGVALGVVGLFLPLLPTTPFLLLAAACYSRSSQRFYDGLLANRWCGPYLRHYREGRGITRYHKTLILILLWTTIGFSAGFVVTRGWIRILLGVIALAVTVHILTLKTFHPSPPATDVAGGTAPAKEPNPA